MFGFSFFGCFCVHLLVYKRTETISCGCIFTKNSYIAVCDVFLI